MPPTRQQRRAATRAGITSKGRAIRRVVVAAVGLVLVGSGAWLLWDRYVREPPVRDGGPNWSPDGKQIVFYEVRNGSGDLFVMNADGSNARPLTDTPADEGGPAFSPDGRQIAFDSDRDGNFEIYVMNADGSNVRRLTNAPSRHVSPAWSPDGTHIAFMSDRDARPEFDVYTMHADGSSVERVTTGETNWFPQYSPDGTRLAFHVGRDVHVLDVATRTLRRLTTDPDNGMYPSWSPDGAHLAFMSWRHGMTEIFTMNADGSDQRVLVSLPVDSAIDPRWSPDGSRIVFVRTSATEQTLATVDTAGTAIYTVDVATGALRRLSRR
jgi:Tol biopolymer transport system component